MKKIDKLAILSIIFALLIPIIVLLLTLCMRASERFFLTTLLIMKPAVILFFLSPIIAIVLGVKAIFRRKNFSALSTLLGLLGVIFGATMILIAFLMTPAF